ncbi:MAG: nucleoside 2-deoxyribosyltransferase, partial [Acidobacteria bacterium]|nr:nucleoside 2-deoxyribosyltransferase [Acidobacteriota bacterium]
MTKPVGGVQRSPLEIPWRVRLGVTGHRTLAAPVAIASRVAEVLSTAIPDFVRSSAELGLDTPIYYLAITPLAEGADRLVAREVLALEGAVLEVVLPLDEEEYEKDFDTEKSVEEFRKLLSRAARRVRLHGGLDPGVSLAAAARREAYVEAGRYVVDHCDVLLAVWDGEPPRGKGGTAEVVDYARKLGRPVVLVGAENPHAVSVDPGTGLDCSSVAGVHQFNSAGRPDAEHAYVGNLETTLFENALGQAVPEAARGTIREVLLPVYARASLPAKGHRRFFERAGLWVQVLSVAAVASVAAGVLWPVLSPEAFGLELASLLAILWIISAAHRSRSHRNWID